MGLLHNIKDKLKEKAGKAMLAFSAFCGAAFMFLVSLGQAAATTATDAVNSIYDIIPLMITLVILSSIFGLIGGMMVFGRRK